MVGLHWTFARKAERRACALTAIGEEEGLRRLCQCKSIRCWGLKGDRARTTQMGRDKREASPVEVSSLALLLFAVARRFPMNGKLSPLVRLMCYYRDF